MIIDQENETAATEDWHHLTSELRDTTMRQIADLVHVQVDLQKWYAMKPGRQSQALELNACPALLRVMQIIRLLRESQLEFEKALEEPKATR